MRKSHTFASCFDIDKVDAFDEKGCYVNGYDECLYRKNKFSFYLQNQLYWFLD